MPRPDVRAERIPQITQAAMRVFARQGFAQTRMDDIAHEAGLSKATLYLYFTSKDELISAILADFFTQGFSELSQLAARHASVSTGLETWTRQQMDAMQQNAAFLSIGFEFHGLATRHSPTREIMQRYYDQYRTQLGNLLKHGIEHGEFQPHNSQELALALISIYEGLTMLWMLNPTVCDPSAIACQTVQQLLSTITIRHEH